MTLEQFPAVPPDYRDRRTGLIVFGALTASMGAVLLLFVPLVLLAQFARANTTGVAPASQRLIPGIIICGALATTFMWLGIGSILCRRWARALLWRLFGR